MFFIKPFFKYLKKHTYTRENTWEKLFADTVFEIFKKMILTNLKNGWDNFSANILFQNI